GLGRRRCRPARGCSGTRRDHLPAKEVISPCEAFEEQPLLSAPRTRVGPGRSWLAVYNSMGEAHSAKAVRAVSAASSGRLQSRLKCNCTTCRNRPGVDNRVIARKNATACRL